MTKDEAIELLSNKKLDIERVDEIYEEFKGDRDVEGQTAMNLSQKTSVYDRDEGKSETIVELLRKLSKSEDMGARWAVAKNPHTPIDILEELGQDKINLVRALIATNPSTPSKVLDKLFSDEKIVRDGLSGNPNTPLKLLKVLSDDKDKMVRMRLAENSSATDTILKKLMNDSDENVAKAAEVNLKKRSES